MQGRAMNSRKSLPESTFKGHRARIEDPAHESVSADAPRAIILSILDLIFELPLTICFPSVFVV